MSKLWTQMPHFCGGRAYFTVVRLGILTVLCPLLLSACGESYPSGYSGSPTSDTLKPVAAPPGADEQPPLPGTTGAPKTAEGLPTLTAKGTNTNLFSAEMSNEVSRIERLENAVQELRNDFDAMSPAIMRLVSIEKDMQNLISQLEVLTGGGAAAPIPPIEESALEAPEPIQPESVPLPMPPAGIAADETAMAEPSPIMPIPQPSSPAQEPAAVPAPSPAPVPLEATAPPVPLAPAAPAAPAAAPAPSGVAVTGVRVGEHPGKIRIVLDVKGKTSYTTDLDNTEHILVVELPQAGWNAEGQKTFPASHPLLSSYRTEKLGDNGTLLILQLKKSSSLAYKAAMNDPATGGSKVVIDLTTK